MPSSDGQSYESMAITLCVAHVLASRSHNQEFDPTSIVSLFEDLCPLASNVVFSDQLLLILAEAQSMAERCRPGGTSVQTTMRHSCEPPPPLIDTSSTSPLNVTASPGRAAAGGKVVKVKTVSTIKRKASSWPRQSRMTKEESLKQCLLEISSMPRSTMRLAGVGKIGVSRRTPRSKLPRAKFAIQDAMAEDGEDERDFQGEGQDTSALCVGFAALGV
ncbi:hypothetical protein LTR97_011746 [Elasticomyces elasticus]|uniref:Uncharacterized protein n=1 Tax=Elasticomyces elasticus TaxID=574655 RepID=A0AAN7VWH5_9PEZI|nr:hypothetical protein LTR97_011746 [Elasticomyces elasticus]